MLHMGLLLVVLMEGDNGLPLAYPYSFFASFFIFKSLSLHAFSSSPSLLLRVVEQTQTSPLLHAFLLYWHSDELHPRALRYSNIFLNLSNNN
jgi:hypothetical protein